LKILICKNFKIWNIQIQGLLKDFQGPGIFSKIQGLSRTSQGPYEPLTMSRPEIRDERHGKTHDETMSGIVRETR